MRKKEFFEESQSPSWSPVVLQCAITCWLFGGEKKKKKKEQQQE